MNDRFNHPDTLSSEKRKLLEMLLTEDGGMFNAFPLSFAQQRLWFLDQLYPDTPLYNIPAALRLCGTLHIHALRRSLQALVERHESLRTTFAIIGGQPIQVIAPPLRMALPLTDLGALPDRERTAQLRWISSSEARLPFDLAAGPLLRTTLVRLTETEHVLLLTMHHIVADGWSVGVFMRDLAAFYDSCFTNQHAQLPDLPIQYADFARWQRQWLQGEVIEKQLAYWRAQLGGDLPVLELPIDHPRPASQSFSGATQRFALSAPLTSALKTLSQREGASLFMVLFAAFQTLLHRYSGQDDLLVGVPIANRTRIEMEDVIGCFVNTLVLRGDLTGNPSFREYLGRVRQVCLSAYAHQDLPFERLVEELRPERSLSHFPLFQVLFTFQNIPRPALELVGLNLNLIDVDSGLAKLDLTLNLEEWPEGLGGWLGYSTDLFDAPRMVRMTGHLETLLKSIVANPERRLTDLALLTEHEQQQLLVEWNGTAADYPSDQCVHQLFAVQVARAPDTIAVVFAGMYLTYQELNQRARQLACYLGTLGVGPEALVGLYLERSLEMLVGILGVLKAGAAYVPLDPAYPQERLSFMLADARVMVLLTNLRFVQRLPAQAAPVICLDRDWARITLTRGENPSSLLHSQNPAYMIYTSGSTGVPKAVLITHRNLVHSTCARFLYYQQPVSSYLLLSSFAFDSSVVGVFWTLCQGGCLVLPQEGMQWELAEVARLMARQQISHMLSLPSLYSLLLREAPRHQLVSLQVVIVAGEACPRSVVEQHHNVLPAALIVNEYGPTEATVWSSVHRCRSAEPETRVLIGRPIANSQLYLLDTRMQPTPLGVPGEVYIGGDGLARGYHHRPELTAERFVPNPFAGVSGIGYWVLGTESSDTRYLTPDTRLYKTGDLARYRPDGSIEFLGRLDGQVKLRGYRIELGEIEAVLGRHPAVREAVVVAREERAAEDGYLERRLVAYVVPMIAERRTMPRGRPDERPATEDRRLRIEDSDARTSAIFYPQSSELRSFLQERLPDYMVPLAFVLLDTLPLTPNGKVDRRALPVPDRWQEEDGNRPVMPRTPIEEVLAGIWADLLRLKQISVDDSFFALGGHSLLATQMLARVCAIFQVDLSLRSLFEAPTMAALAVQIETIRRASQGTTPPLRVVARDAPLPLSFAQQRLWVLDQLAPGSSAYNIPLTVRLRGPLNLAAIGRSLKEIVRRHEALRTTFMVVDGQPVQVIAPPQPLLLPVLDLHLLPKATAVARRYVTELAQQPFDLVKGPLWRALFLRLAETEHILLVTTHHIVFDGSTGIFLRELSALYATFSVGDASPLPILPIQYADFASWQREWLRGEILAAQLAYWRTQLGGSPPVLQLPTDRPRSAVQSFQGASQSLMLSRELSEALQMLSQRSGVTLFMTLLAAFQLLLHRYSSQDDIVVGFPIVQHNRPEIMGLIGCFVNTLVLRTNLSRNPGFTTLLGRVRAVCLDAYAHQDLPFEQLVETLQPTRDLSHTPLFQVMFTLQHALFGELVLPGLTLSPVMIESRTARFDLLLGLVEGSDGLTGVVEYNTDIFEPTTITRLLRHFRTLLHSIVAGVEQRLSDLPLLTQAEHHQLLVDWNDTTLEVKSQESGVRVNHPVSDLLASDFWLLTSDSGCIHHLFERQVTQTPDAVAVILDGLHLTYDQLNARANQLAQHLLFLEVYPATIIAVYMERSVELIPALLGILKAGGAYVPLETSFPPARMQQILGALQIRCMITQSSLIRGFESLDQLFPTLEHLICLEPSYESKPLETAALGAVSVWTCLDLDQHPQENLAAPGDPDGLAYIIFTSGSAGTPKGVMVRHRAVVNLIDWVNRTFVIGALDRGLFITSLCFDLSVYDIFGLLAAGGAIRVASRQEVHDPEKLLHVLCTELITFWDSAPAALQQLVPFFPVVPSLNSDHLLRLVFVSGDWIPVTLPAAVRSTFPGAAVISLGGATEATVWSNYYPIGAVEPGWASIPYGKPIQNAQYYILDRYLNPCPIGVPGNLYIGGTCLAYGYAHEPILTAAQFMPHPYSALPGARLYHTGDRARYFPDGTIEFLGRLDQQVKIRGFRIELGEVEAVLSQLSAVRESVVEARIDERGDKRLVAYVVPNREQENAELGTASLSPVTCHLSPTELRRFLQTQLPDYMVPAVFVILEELPLTPNGKVDRRALPAPEEVRSTEAAPFVAPRTPIEELLVGMWMTLLSRERISVYESFFDLGGHSLLATQLVSRLRATFQVELPLRSLFEGPTIAELAARIEIARRTTPALTAPPILPAPRDQPLPLSFAQQRLWFLDRLAPLSPAYTIPLALRLSGTLKLPALRRSLSQIVCRHEILRTIFTLCDDQPVQRITPACALPLPLLDLQALPTSQRDTLALQQAQLAARTPFDLEHGPLLRITLLRLAAQEHILLLTLHHIVADGWSMGVLLRELVPLYAALAMGQSSPLPALPLQYADYALWQREWLQGEVLERQLAYWRRQLAGAPAVLNLPIDHPRPLVQRFGGASVAFALSAELTERLQALSRLEGVTLFMTLLAAFQIQLHYYTDQDDIVVGTDIANRNWVEIEALIGFFVNQLVLRADMSGDPSFQALLGRVREVTLAAYAHQDLPFEKLVEALNPKRGLKHSPLFHVKIILQNIPIASLEIPNLTVSVLNVSSGAAQFDLILNLVETAQGLVGMLEYNTELFKESTIARMARHFELLLSTLVAQPDAALSALEARLAEEDDRQQIIKAAAAEAGRHQRLKGIKRKTLRVAIEKEE